MKVKDGKKTITTQIAYIAGFFDGEGCVRIKEASQKGNSYYVWVAITNSNKQILEEVAELFGGQVRRAEKTVNKVIYHYLITSSEAVDFLMVLQPFLKDKAEQVRIAIAFHQQKDGMTREMKRLYAKRVSDLKREVIGNIYENPDLLNS